MGSAPVAERASARDSEATTNSAQRAAASTTSYRLAPATKKNEIKVMVDDHHLSIFALVNRRGLKKLMKILEASSTFLDEGNDD